jgi:hypothetical protein
MANGPWQMSDGKCDVANGDFGVNPEGSIAQKTSDGKQFTARKARDGEPFFATLGMTD